MIRSVRIAAVATVAAIALALLAACAVVSPSEPPVLYDLGPPGTAPTSKLPALPSISIVGVSAPAWLDGTVMYYRLNYANDQQPQPYAHARWTMPPAQLLQQELKSRIAGSGGTVLSAADADNHAPLLRIELDDFTQGFSGPGQSSGHVGLLATVFKGRKLLAQKSFSTRAPAPSADATGGARALATASDAVIADVIRWLATLDLK